MKLATIEAKVSRDVLKCEDYTKIMKTKCIQECEIERDKLIEFLTPMTDLIAQMIIADIDKE